MGGIEASIPSGTVELFGQDTRQLDASRLALVRQQIGLIFEDFKLFADRQCPAERDAATGDRRLRHRRGAPAGPCRTRQGGPRRPRQTRSRHPASPEASSNACASPARWSRGQP
jgi:hypothetical protein